MEIRYPSNRQHSQDFLYRPPVTVKLTIPLNRPITCGRQGNSTSTFNSEDSPF